MEYSGTVVSAPAGSGHEEGSAVYISGMEAGPRSYGEYQRWGGMASYSVAPVRAVSAIPEPLDMAQAATLNGELALVHGATGATGLAAVQVCSALGVDVIATGGSD